jgi:negative regulator of flagellin synthesis FlgM
MTNVNNAVRSNFFPGTKTNTQKSGELAQTALKRNDAARISEIKSNTGEDSKVQIPEAIRDFSRIKKVVDAVPERDNSEKIAKLKQQIQAGTYKTDYEALADKILQQEF